MNLAAQAGGHADEAAITMTMKIRRELNRILVGLFFIVFYLLLRKKDEQEI